MFFKSDIYDLIERVKSDTTNELASVKSKEQLLNVVCDKLVDEVAFYEKNYAGK